MKKVEWSEWASTVVIVPKPDGSVRICSDYKVSINKVVEDTPYPLPTADDIFSTLAGGQAFTKSHLSNAFNQLKVDESSSPLSEDKHYEMSVPTIKTSMWNQDSATHVSKCDGPGIARNSRGLLLSR